jgi:hypothetical protein
LAAQTISVNLPLLQHSVVMAADESIAPKKKPVKKSRQGNSALKAPVLSTKSDRYCSGETLDDKMDALGSYHTDWVFAVSRRVCQHDRC